MIPASMHSEGKPVKVLEVDILLRSCLSNILENIQIEAISFVLNDILQNICFCLFVDIPFIYFLKGYRPSSRGLLKD